MPPAGRQVRESRAVAIWLDGAPQSRSSVVRRGILRGEDPWSLLTEREQDEAIRRYLIRFPGDADAVAR